MPSAERAVNVTLLRDTPPLCSHFAHQEVGLVLIGALRRWLQSQSNPRRNRALIWCNLYTDTFSLCTESSYQEASVLTNHYGGVPPPPFRFTKPDVRPSNRYGSPLPLLL